MKVSVGENSEYVNLGDWISYFTYGVFDGETLKSKVSRTRYPLIFSAKTKGHPKWSLFILFLSDHSFNSILHS
jgi:hypothetical protein